MNRIRIDGIHRDKPDGIDSMSLILKIRSILNPGLILSIL